VLATFISGLAAALAALLIELEVLVQMMSIGKRVFVEETNRQPGILVFVSVDKT
jgi:hypothetical protein